MLSATDKAKLDYYTNPVPLLAGVDTFEDLPHDATIGSLCLDFGTDTLYQLRAPGWENLTDGRYNC